MYPEDFENFVKQKCQEQRELLEREWIPKCAKIILDLKDFWRHLVPLEEDELLDLPMKFFACIAIEMSNQLRNLVVDSLAEFVNFFEQYSVREICFKSENFTFKLIYLTDCFDALIERKSY